MYESINNGGPRAARAAKNYISPPYNKFSQNHEIWSKSQNLVEIVKFGQNCEIWSKL